MEMPWFLDMSHSMFFIYIFTISTIGTIPYKNGDSNTIMIILWYWNSCTMVFTSQGKFKTTIVLLLRIFTKTQVMYNALTKSAMVLPLYSWKEGKVRGHLKHVCNNLSSFSSSLTSVLCGSHMTFSKQMN